MSEPRINSVDVLAASLALRRLRDVGLLKSEGRSTATYYRGTPLLLGEPESPNLKAALSSGLSPNPKKKGLPTLQLSPDLVQLLRRIGERSPDRRLMELDLRHMLGVSERCRRGYRNYFVAGGDDVASMERLRASGFVIKNERYALSANPCYHATVEGARALGLRALPR